MRFHYNVDEQVTHKGNDAVTARMVVVAPRHSDGTPSYKPWRLCNVVLSCLPHAGSSLNATAITEMVLNTCDKFQIDPITLTTDNCATNLKMGRNISASRHRSCAMPLHRVACMAHAYVGVHVLDVCICPKRQRLQYACGCAALRRQCGERLSTSRRLMLWSRSSRVSPATSCPHTASSTTLKPLKHLRARNLTCCQWCQF